jgi:hypothetical protein
MKDSDTTLFDDMSGRTFLQGTLHARGLEG